MKFKYLFLCLISSAITAPISNTVRAADAELIELESQVEASGVNVEPKVVNPQNWTDAAEATTLLLKSTMASDRCVEQQLVKFAERYAVSISKETGKPCRLYDLSFPTLSAALPAKLSSLPAQKFSARDYLDWINGRQASVISRSQAFAANQNAAVGAAQTADWVQRLQFRNQNQLSLSVGLVGVSRRLPRSFRLSDLELGIRFGFSASERSRLTQLISQLSLLQTQAGDPSVEGQEWQALIDRPEALLERVRFDWNDAKKVYDIALEGNFVPLKGPVILVDYQMPYRLAAERMIRQILSSALWNLSRLIPEPTTRGIVGAVIDDGFEFIEMMYVYHGNMLEGSLRLAMKGQIPSQLDRSLLNSTMNLHFGGRSDLMSEYIMSVAQGQKFDWSAIEKIGARARYTVEKQRDITMNQTNSRLVLQKNCQMQMFQDYFGICRKSGQQHSVYSLISQNTLLFWNMGAPVVYKYNIPAEVSIKRGAAYLLSFAVRVFDIRLSPRVKLTLADALKGFAYSGATDEAFLRNALWLEKRMKGQLTPAQQSLLTTLYWQNMNPLLAKVETQEERLINANSQGLKFLATQEVR